MPSFPPPSSSDGRTSRCRCRCRWAPTAAIFLLAASVRPSAAAASVASAFATAPPPRRAHEPDGWGRDARGKSGWAPRKSTLPFSKGGTGRGFGVLGDSLDDDSFGESSEDWRAFRAKLVQRERKSLAEDEEGGGRDGTGTEEEGEEGPRVMTVPTTERGGCGVDGGGVEGCVDGDGEEGEGEEEQSWAYESGDMIERGTVLLHDPPEPRGGGDLDPDDGGFGYGLGRQYLHKSVVLVLEAGGNGDGSNGSNGGDQDPTKGVILNRPTDLILSDEDCDDRDETCSTETPSFRCRVWYGGPEFGIHSESPKFYCLHALSPSSDVHRRAVLDLSREVLPGIYFATLANAKRLVRMGLAESMQRDFWVFCGFVGWHPGELVEELRDDADWRALSTDSETVRRGLRVLTAGGGEGSRVDPRDGGIRSWTMLTDMICGGGGGGQHRSGDATSTASTAASFDDMMLREWARENLVFHGNGGDGSRDGRTKLPKFLQEQSEMDSEEESLGTSPSEAEGAPRLGPGTLLRGSASTPSPFLLSDQEYHKSVVLLLQDDENFSVGVLLNRVSARTVDLRFAVVLDDDGDDDGGDKERGDDDDALLDNILRRSRIRTVSLPIRYGGPLEIVGHPDDDTDADGGDDGSDLVFLHVSRSLREAGVGEPIGDDADDTAAWRCTKGEAMEAMANGFAGPGEFLVVRGFNVWRKDIGEGGGIGTEVARGNFEVVGPGGTAAARRVWDALLSRNTGESLAPATMDRILEDAEAAWTAAGGGTEEDGREPSPAATGTRGGAEKTVGSARYDPPLPENYGGEGDGEGERVSVFDGGVEASSLGDDALKAWVAAYLLGDPTLRP